MSEIDEPSVIVSVDKTINIIDVLNLFQGHQNIDRLSIILLTGNTTFVKVVQ